MRRRDVIKGVVSSAVAWPLAARAQHSAIPVIGYLDSRSPEAVEDRLRGFRQGLKEAGYTEGENITILYRWADDRMDRLPLLAADLVSRSVAAIITAGPPSALAAKAATTSIPIIFLVGSDPVQLGLATSLSRPTGNLTGIDIFTGESVAKRLEVLRDLLPHAARMGVLVNPADAGATDAQLKEIDAAARAMGLQIQVHNADTRDRSDGSIKQAARLELVCLHDSIFCDFWLRGPRTDERRTFQALVSILA